MRSGASPRSRRTRAGRPGPWPRSATIRPRTKASPRTRPSQELPAMRLRRGRPGSLRVWGGRESRWALREQSPGVEDVVGAHPAFSNHRDTGAEDVRQRALVVDQHRGRAVLLGELDVQASIAALNVVLHHARNPNVTCCGLLRAEL